MYQYHKLGEGSGCWITVEQAIKSRNIMFGNFTPDPNEWKWSENILSVDDVQPTVSNNTREIEWCIGKTVDSLDGIGFNDKNYMGFYIKKKLRLTYK